VHFVLKIFHLVALNVIIFLRLKLSQYVKSTAKFVCLATIWGPVKFGGLATIWRGLCFTAPGYSVEPALDVECYVFNPVKYLTHQGATPSWGRSLALDDVERHVFNPVNYLTHQGQHRAAGEVCYLRLPCIVVCRLADEWDEHSRLALDDVEHHVFNPVNYLTHQGAAPSRGRSLLSTIAVYCRV